MTDDLAKYTVQNMRAAKKKPRSKKVRSDYERKYAKLTNKIRAAKHPAMLCYYIALRADLVLSCKERAGTKKARDRQAEIARLQAAYDDYKKRYTTRNGCPSNETIGHVSMADLPFTL
jgi:hypothetical protein